MKDYVWICDLACVIYTNKHLPNNCLHIISSFIGKIKPISSKNYDFHYECVEKGSRKNTKKLVSKVRIKRSIRWR